MCILSSVGEKARRDNEIICHGGAKGDFWESWALSGCIEKMGSIPHPPVAGDGQIRVSSSCREWHDWWAGTILLGVEYKRSPHRCPFWHVDIVLRIPHHALYPHTPCLGEKNSPVCGNKNPRVILWLPLKLRLKSSPGTNEQEALQSVWNNGCLVSEFQTN